MRTSAFFASWVLVQGVASAAPQGSSVAVDPNSGVVWVAEHDGRKLVVSDPGARHVLRSVPLAGEPAQVMVGVDGASYASLPALGMIARVAKGTRTAYSPPLGRQPEGLAMSEDGAMLLVTLAGEAAIVTLDPETLLPLRRVEVEAEPRAIAVNGSEAIITHLIGQDVTVLQLPHGGGDPKAAFAQKRISLDSEHGVGAPDSAIAMAIDPRYGSVYVPHEIADTSSRGGGTYGGASGPPIQFGLTVVDLGRKVATPVPEASQRASVYGRGDRSCATELSQPSAIAFDRENARIFVAGLGSDAIPAFDAMVVPGGQRFCVRLPRGSGPTGLAISPKEDWLYVYLSFRHELAAVALPSYKNEPFDLRARTLRVGSEPMSAQLVHGRELFYAAGNTRQSAHGELPCGCCHPNGLQDGRVWQIDGEPRQTPILAGRLVGTGPYNWLGSKKTLQANMKETVHRLGGSGLSPQALADLEAYLTRGLRPPPAASYQQDLVVQGRKVFNDGAVGCAHCHDPGHNFTDGKMHDVFAVLRVPMLFKTPSLLGISRGAPYLHDGSVETLRELLSSWNEEDRMGRTSQLEPQQLDALLAYLETL